MTTAGREFLQQATHAELIEPAIPAVSPGRANASPDAIIVPAARPAENLGSAIKLAVDADCHLVVLCSRGARPLEVNRFLRQNSVDDDQATVITVKAADYLHDLFRFQTTGWIQGVPGYQNHSPREHDLSLKRNIGLVLARLLGWQRIFFMDDDIRDVDALALSSLVSLLGPHRTAGMAVREFPDNSVVCHARRDVKRDQDVFVSGSVLAVDCTAPFGFFPDIYNEDWLFFYHDAAEKRLANPGFNVRQDQYDPFADPQRAVRQEFGDIIAEGIYSLLHSGHGLEYATKAYWSQFLDDRAQIISDIIARLDYAPGEKKDEMCNAIKFARRTLAGIKPGMCATYLEIWQGDLERWEKRRDGLQRADNVADALRMLGLSSPRFPSMLATAGDIGCVR